MSTKIHIFFNGDECFFPPGCAWEKFKGLDAARTFAICAESWRRNGWDVSRFSTLGNDFPETMWRVNGECSKSFGWYPAPFWQWVAKAKQIAARDTSAFHWFGTMDVLNFGFSPQDCPHHGERCVSLQREHFSMALLRCNYDWLSDAEETLMRYDRQILKPLARDYTSDETILRNYPPEGTRIHPGMTFANNTEKDAFPLLHFSRSAIPFHYGQIPVS